MYWILKRPITTEKSKYAELEKVYTFIVDDRATKIDIKKAFFELYKVMPRSVRILYTREKFKFGKSRNLVRRQRSEKKALIAVNKEITNFTKLS